MKINFSLLTLFLLTTVLSFGQLSVRNTAFVYASDVLVYVEDDVKIEETTANIYLRDEAQLIQGAGITGNSGEGKLSIYQRGTVNQYAYNYWCSPVGNVGSNNNSNLPFIPNNNLFDVTAAPITSASAGFTTGYDGTSSPLVISSAWLWTYSPGYLYADWDYLDEDGLADAGMGFTMKGTSGSGNNQLYDFRGKPNNGTITADVLAPIGPEPQFTLIGNPYPSAIDAYDLIWDADNKNAITGVLHYWEQAPGAASHFLEDYVGGYGLYTIDEFTFADSFTPAAFTTYLADGTPTNFNAGMGSKTAKRYIPVGQGFMVEGAVGSPGTVFIRNNFREYVKESSGTSYFFSANPNGLGITVGSSENLNPNEDALYGEHGLNIVPEGFLRFRLNIDLQKGTNYYTRQLLMNLVDHATDGFDYGLEAKAESVLDSDAHWILENVPYLIQAFAFDESLKIPVVVELNEQQPLRFRLFDVQNFNEGQPIYLHDIENSLYIDLRIQDYQLTLEPGQYPDRFEITFVTEETLGVSEISIDELQVFQNNNAGQFTILNPSLLEIIKVDLYDVSGKRIFNFDSIELDDEYHYPTKNLSDGVYVANITLSNGKMVNKKVVIKND